MTRPALIPALGFALRPALDLESVLRPALTAAASDRPLNLHLDLPLDLLPALVSALRPAPLDAGGSKKKETKLGLAHSKAGDFGGWYSEVCTESELLSYYDVSGKSCLIKHVVRLLVNLF